jgi:hypothetical protein
LWACFSKLMQIDSFIILFCNIVTVSIAYLKIPCKEYSYISQTTMCLFMVLDMNPCNTIKVKYSHENPCPCSLHFTSYQNKTYKLELTSVSLLTNNKGPLARKSIFLYLEFLNEVIFGNLILIIAQVSHSIVLWLSLVIKMIFLNVHIMWCIWKNSQTRPRYIHSITFHFLKIYNTKLFYTSSTCIPPLTCDKCFFFWKFKHILKIIDIWNFKYIS